MLNKVISIISEYQDIPANTIHADSHLVNDLGFTSYDVVSLVGKFEDEFDIEVPDRKIKMMKTVDDIVKFIEAATSTLRKKFVSKEVGFYRLPASAPVRL